MEQLATGKLISKRRGEKNLTQAQLAAKLGVSDKTVSKWETGKCMPDYRVVKSLCKELEITAAELIGGEEAGEKNVQAYGDEQIMDLLKRIQSLKKQKIILDGILLIVMGIALQASSRFFGGSNAADFISGVLMGVSIPEMLVGVYVIGTGLSRR